MSGGGFWHLILQKSRDTLNLKRDFSMRIGVYYEQGKEEKYKHLRKKGKSIWLHICYAVDSRIFSFYFNTNAIFSSSVIM